MLDTVKDPGPPNLHRRLLFVGRLTLPGLIAIGLTPDVAAFADEFRRPTG